MPRCGLLLVTLTAATLAAQPGSNQSTAVDPSQTRPAAPAVSKPDKDAQTPKSELVASPTPRSLALPQRGGLDPEAARLLSAISLCDPVACLGEGPKLVWVDGKWTIRFPDSYKKPAATRLTCVRKSLPRQKRAVHKGLLVSSRLL
jgi:hypothetical protein